MYTSTQVLVEVVKSGPEETQLGKVSVKTVVPNINKQTHTSFVAAFLT